ncbi:MAG: hypothetical protein ACK5SI_00390, partial [Planctomycetia bacterium]
MFSPRDPTEVDRFFRGLTEYAFHARLGVVDPELIDYVALLLVRFLRHDRVTALPGVGREEAADVSDVLLAVRRHAAAEVGGEEYLLIGAERVLWGGVCAG